MKKDIKKKLITSSIATGLTAAAITPVAIALENGLSENTLLLNQRDTKAAINSGNFNLTNNSTLSIGVTNQSANTVYATNPNVTRAIPNGIVTVANQGKRIICYSTSNPNNLRWYSDLDNCNYIYGIEYTPYNDALVALYMTNDNQLNVANFKSISNNSNGSKVNPQISNVTQGSPTNAWAITPLIWADRSRPAEAFYIYDRRVPATSTYTRTYLFYVADNTVDYRTVKWDGYNDKQENFIIALSAYYNNQITTPFLRVIRDSPTSVTGKMYANVLTSSYRELTFSTSREIPLSNFGGYKLDLWNYDLTKVANSLTTTYGVQKDNYIRTTFVLNTGLDYNTGKQQGSTYLVTIETEIFYRNAYVWPPTLTNVVKINNGVKHAYFSTESITSGGILKYKYSDLQPLVFMGNNSNIQTGDGIGKYVGVISNALNNNSYSVSSQSTSSSNYVIYPMANNAAANPNWSNSSNRWIYSGFDTSIDAPVSGLGLNQEAFGIPVLEYSDNRDNSNDRYTANTRNIHVLKSGSNDVEIINQASNSKSQNYKQNQSTYFYNTRLRANSLNFGLGDPTINVSTVDLNYVNNKFNIEASNWVDSEFLQSILKLTNVNKGARFAINPKTYKIDRDNGSVTFDLYTTMKYDDLGRWQYSSSFEQLKRDFPAVNFLSTITISGYRPDSNSTGLTGGELSGVSNIYPSQWQANNDRIKQAIISSGKFYNTYGTLASGDITLTNVSFDDSIGYLTVTVQVNNNKALMNSTPVPSLTLAPVTFSGFKVNSILNTTTFTGGSVSGFNNTVPSDVDTSSTQFLSQIAALIKYPVVGQTITASDIFVTVNQLDNTTGTMLVSVTVNNSKVWFEREIISSYTFINQTITGFKTQQATSLKNATIAKGDDSLRPSDWYVDEATSSEKLKNFIIENKSTLLEAIPNNLSPANIFIQNVERQNPSGNLVVTFTLDNYYDAQGILVTDSQSSPFTFTITGFKLDDSSTTVTGGALSIGSVYSSEWEANRDAIKQAIISSGLITNLFTNNLTLNDIQLTDVSFDNALGTLTTNLVITNGKAQLNGQSINQVTLPAVTFSGFRIDSQLSTTKFNGGPISGFNTTLATETLATNANLIAQVISLVKNPVSGQTITSRDVTITIISTNNLNGSMTIDLKVINSKVWINGEVQSEYTFRNQTITGFKIQQSTNLAQSTVLINDQTIASIKPSAYYSDTQDNAKLQQLIYQNRGSIFVNLPTQDFVASNISIKNVVANNPTGSLLVSFTLYNWFNTQGILSFDESVQFNLTIQGFKQDSSTTSIQAGDLGLNSIMASQWEGNLNIIKQAIIAKIQNPFNSNISTNDLSLANVSFDDGVGSLTATVVIFSGKAQSGGLQVNSLPITVTFTGFMPNAILITTQFNGGPISGFENTLPENVQPTDVQLLTKIAGLIKYSANGQQISASDISIKITNRNNVNGSITVALTVYNSKVWINGEIQSEYTFAEQVITGFKVNEDTMTTRFIGGSISGFQDTLPTELNESDSNFVNQIISLISYTSNNLSVTPSDVEITVVSRNNVDGSIVINLVVKNNKAWINGLTQSQVTFSNQKVTGFATQLPTTLVNTTANIGVASFRPSDFYSGTNDNQRLQTLIAENVNRIFTNIPDEFDYSNVIISSVSINNPNGMLSVMFSLNKFINNNGILVQDEITSSSYVLNIIGFKQDNSTTTIKDGKLSGVSSFYPSQWENNQDAIKKAIISSGLLSNLFNIQISASDLQLTNCVYNDGLGTLTTKINIFNTKAQQNGYAENIFSLNTVTLSGFKVNEALVTTSLPGGTIQGFDDQIASSVRIDDNEFLMQIIELIESPASGQIIYPEDLLVKIISTDNLTGSMTISVTIINGKAWNKGIVEESMLLPNAVINGFKIQKPTAIANQTIQTIDSSVRASDYYVGSQDDEKLQGIIYSQRNYILSDVPASLTASGILIRNVEINNAQGSMTIVFVLSSFYDATGILREGAESVPFTITITGFKQDNSTTSAIPVSLEDVDKILPSAYSRNIDAVKGAIIASKSIQNLFNKNITIDDVVLTNVTFSDSMGTLTASLIINNYKAQQNGLLVESLQLDPVTFSGFAINEALTSTQFLGGQISGFENTLPQNTVVSEQLINQIIPLIKYPALDGEIESSDVEILIVSRNNVGGSIVVNLIVNNSKAWINGVVQSSMNFDNVTLTGFKVQQPTSLKTDQINIGISSIFPFDFYLSDGDEDNEKVANLIFENNLIIFNNLPTTFSASNINISPVEPDDTYGQLVVSFTLSDYFDSNGEQTNITGATFTLTITGFRTDTTTTLFNGGTITGFANTFANEMKANNEKLLNQIITLINYPTKKLTTSDIVVFIKSFDNLSGSLTIDLTIKNSKAQKNGNVLTQVTFNNKVLRGFKSQQPTIFNESANQLSVDSSQATIFASDFTNDQISSLIFNNKNTLFRDLPSDFTSSNIIVKNRINNETKGTIDLLFVIDNFYNASGVKVNGLESKTYKVKINGLKALETTSTTLNGGIITGYENDLPSVVDILNSTEIKRQIISFISNPANDQTISTSDLTISNIVYQNSAGSVTVDVTINNSKVIINGEVKSSYTFTSVALQGFAAQGPTQLINSSITLNNSFSKSSDINSDAQLRALIYANKDNLFINLPSDFTVNDIIISNSKSNNKDGSLVISFSLLKYYDENGMLVSSFGLNNSSRAFNDFNLTIDGFLIDSSSSNKIIPIILMIVGGVLLLGVVVWLVIRERRKQNNEENQEVEIA